MHKVKNMKIIRVASGAASLILPEFRGNVVTDGAVHYFYDSGMAFWAIHNELFNYLECAILASEEPEAVLEVTKDPVSITDLLALKTTFHTDDIIKLKEHDLL